MFLQNVAKITSMVNSGVDIRGVLSDQGVFVAANGAVSPVHLRWQPCIYLVDTGCVGITAAAVSRVMALQSEPWAHAVDQDMICSVTSMQKALQSSSGSCAVLADAMRLAQSCFYGGAGHHRLGIIGRCFCMVRKR